MSIEDNKRIVKRGLEEPWTNIGVIDEIMAEDYIGLDPAVPEPIRGIRGARENVERYLAAFPDGRITVEDQLAEGDMVATRWTGRGTHEGDLIGIAPTGKQATVTGMTISRVEGGKIVQEWTNWDTFGLMVQLGVVEAPAPA
jgi:predicted ester cyclase